jgi:hypothetical protein
VTPLPESTVERELAAMIDQPRASYSERLRAREAALAQLERRDASFSKARVACFVGFLLLVVAGWQLQLSWAWLLVPVLAFVILAMFHERVIERRDAARRAVAHYREGLDRLAGRWAGNGVTATDFCDAEHPYAQDLDLFGVGSLFDLLCRARTRAGEEQFARWLTCHADARVDASAIAARQRSVQALRDELDLREDLAVLGAAARVAVRPAALIEWGRAPARLGAESRKRLAIAGVILPLLTTIGAVAWGLGAGFGPWLLVIAALGSGAVHRALRETLARIAGPVDRFGAELSVLAAVLARIEAASFEDPRLVELRAVLIEQGLRSSDAIAGLRRLAGWYEAQSNGLFAPIAVLLMWGPNFALAIERWRAFHGPHIAGWIAALAELEALSSLAGHAFENPEQVFPEVMTDAQAGAPTIDGEALGHPLLTREACIANDLHLCLPVRAHVISGSNMSGKSTFLRTVGCNVVLALAGGPVRARTLRLTTLRIGATLRVQDSLREGASRFWAELTRLRTISEQAASAPTLFLLDEIFHGTNSHDRRIGAEALLRSLLGRGAIGLMTTHDLALAEAARALEPAATNVHFQDELRDGALHFDYRMREGVVQRSNALELMRSVGLDV